jgi:small subunit ribosomal protein S17
MVEKSKIKKVLEGRVISNKSQKTAIVRVDRLKIHPKYKKRYKVSKKYKIHDENNECKIGDKVIFEECRPLSRDKRWRLVKIVK